MEVPLNITSCFFLLLLRFFQSLTFEILGVICLGLVSLGSCSQRLSVLLGVGCLFSFHQVGEVFSHYFFQQAFCPFLYVFCFWDPYNTNVTVLDVVLEFPEIKINLFFFSLFQYGHSHYLVSQITNSSFYITKLLFIFLYLFYF